MRLLALQRTMARAVMQPLTASEHSQKKAPDGGSMRAYASRFIKPNDRLTSFERLEIYNRQYWFRLFSGDGRGFSWAAVGAGREALRRDVQGVSGRLPFDVVHAAQSGRDSWNRGCASIPSGPAASRRWLWTSCGWSGRTLRHSTARPSLRWAPKISPEPLAPAFA